MLKVKQKPIFIKRKRVCIILRNPVKKRFPISVEEIADKIANKKSNKDMKPWIKAGFERLAVRYGNKEADEFEKDAFYNGTVLLIKKMATPFWKKKPNWYTMEELIQLCYLRLLQTLKLYKPETGAISTWIHFVCMSVLCKEYNGTKTHRQRFFVPDDTHDEESSTKGIEKFGSFNENNLLKIRMRDTIVSLFVENEDKKDILIEIFGNPLNTEYEPPCKLPLMTEVARNLNNKYKYTEVYGFYKDTIQPFFKNSFSDYDFAKVEKSKEKPVFQIPEEILEENENETELLTTIETGE